MTFDGALAPNEVEDGICGGDGKNERDHYPHRDFQYLHRKSPAHEIGDKIISPRPRQPIIRRFLTLNQSTQ